MKPGKHLCLFAILASLVHREHPSQAQVVYEPGVTVTTVAGRQYAESDRDGTGDEAFLGRVDGIAAIGQEAFVSTYFQAITRLKKVSGRTVSTLATLERGFARLVGDPERNSVIMIFGSPVLAVRFDNSGRQISTLDFPPYATISGSVAAIIREGKLGLYRVQTGEFSYLAGGFVQSRIDGKGESAGIPTIYATAISSDLVYLSDSSLRSCTPDGTVTTLARDGYTDASIGAAKAFPSRFAVDKNGNLIFSQQNAIRRLAHNTIKTLAGAPDKSAHFDGDGFNARFAEITGIAVDSLNRLWVSDLNCVRLLTLPESKPPTPPQTAIRMIPSITVRGDVGGVYRIEYQDSALSPWNLFRIVVLGSPVEEFQDADARPKSRVYRVVQVN